MIKYSGVDLTDNFPVKIEDITVSPISLNPVTRQRAMQFGADFVRMGGGTRTVTISFALLTMDAAERESIMQNLRDWAYKTSERTLELPQFENRYLQCVCTQFPDYSYRKWWENKLRIVFTCFNNPFWTSSELVEVPCGTRFSIGGSAPPLVTIERYSPIAQANQTYSDGANSMTFTTIPAGNFVADLNRQTAAIGSASIMRYYVPTSTWLPAKIGAYQTIYGNGMVKYRERWV